MGFSSIVPTASAMVELRANGIEIHFFFPVDANGFAFVSSLHLSIRFSLQDSTIQVKRKIYDIVTALFVQSLHETSKLTDNGNVAWEFSACRYRVYGLPNSQIGVAPEILTPLGSSTSALITPPVINVKTEHDVDNVIDLSDFSNEDVPMQKVVVHDSLPLFPSASYVMPSPCRFVTLTPSVPSTSRPPQTIVQCLRRLGSMPGSKNVLKKIDYNKLKIQSLNHLPPRFYGTQLFVLPVAKVSSSQSRAKSLEGMDKQYDGHVWTKTQTTNITNNVGLAFCFSTCVGHL